MPGHTCVLRDQRLCWLAWLRAHLGGSDWWHEYWWSDPLDVGLRQCGFMRSLRSKILLMWRRCPHIREICQRLNRLSDFIMKYRIGVLYGKLSGKREVRENWLDVFIWRRKWSFTRTFHVHWPIWMKFGIDHHLVMRLRISGFFLNRYSEIVRHFRA